MKKVLILPFHLSRIFENLEYLPEGILEELIFTLSSLKGLQTTSRSTSLYLGANPIPHKEMFSKFDIDYVLEGSIKKEQFNCFFATQLYEAKTEKLIFNAKIPFQIDAWTSALHTLVYKISEEITENKLTQSIAINTTKKREFYQQGLYHWNRFTHNEMNLAITFLKKAIKEDSNFAQPYAALADCYSIIGLMGYDNPIQAFSSAKKAVQKALLLNDKRSESYVSAALVNMYFDKDLPKSKQNLLQALKLNKDNLKAHHVLAMYYIHVLDLNNARKHSLITLKIDPLSLPHFAMMARISLYQRRFKDGLDFVEAGLNINHKAMPLIELRGIINIASGNAENAIEDFKTCIESDSNSPIYLAFLGFTYSKIGFYAEARGIETKINALNFSKKTGVYDYALAVIKLGQQNIKDFFFHLEKAVAFGVGFLQGELLNNPIFNDIKKHPKTKEILIKFGYHDQHQTIIKKKRASNVLTLQSLTKQVLTLDPQDISFIESNDNYVFVYHLKDGIILKTMLRIPLKQIEQQLFDYTYLVRCHKSFMINLEEQMQIHGNSKSSYFESSFFPKRIPISRSRKVVIEALYRDFK